MYNLCMKLHIEMELFMDYQNVGIQMENLFMNLHI